MGISRHLEFAPGVSMQTVRVIILDDLGQPLLEGIEKFELVLRMPVQVALGTPSRATVSINDSLSDRECVPISSDKLDFRHVSKTRNGPGLGYRR